MKSREVSSLEIIKSLQNNIIRRYMAGTNFFSRKVKQRFKNTVNVLIFTGIHRTIYTMIRKRMLAPSYFLNFFPKNIGLVSRGKSNCKLLRRMNFSCLLNLLTSYLYLDLAFQIKPQRQKSQPQTKHDTLKFKT